MCFADEGGGFAQCRTVCVAIVCFEKESSVERTPWRLYGWLLGVLGWRRGELKWRSVKKAASRAGLDTAVLISRIVSEASCYSAARLHFEAGLDGGEVKRRLFREAIERLACGRVNALVVDAHLVQPQDLRRYSRALGAGYARMGDSRRYPGIQIADLLAGACAEGLW